MKTGNQNIKELDSRLNISGMTSYDGLGACPVLDTGFKPNNDNMRVLDKLINLSFHPLIFDVP